MGRRGSSSRSLTSVTRASHDGPKVTEEQRCLRRPDAYPPNLRQRRTRFSSVAPHCGGPQAPFVVIGDRTARWARDEVEGYGPSRSEQLMLHSGR